MTFKRVFDRVCNITCQLPFAHQTLLYIGFTLKLHVLGVHVVSKSVKGLTETLSIVHVNK